MTLAGIILLGIGAIILIIGAFFIIGSNLTWKYDGKTTGKIVDMCFNAYDYNRGESGRVAVGIVSGGGNGGTRRPVFEYCVDGVTYRRAGNVGANPINIHRKIENQVPVNVYYKTEDPFNSTISKTSPLKIVGIVFVSCSVFLIFLGIILFTIGML